MGPAEFKQATEKGAEPSVKRRAVLTDATIKKLARHPAKPGKRYAVMDALVPGFGVRVSDRAHLTYILAGRFPGSKHYTRREIGAVGELSLQAAREKARKWIELNKAGRDPRVEQEREKREEARKKAHTFGSVAEGFLSHWVIGPDPAKPRQRKHKEVSRKVRNDFIGVWGATPIADISRDDVLAIIKAKARTAPAEARNLLTICKSLFGWALDQGYGLDRSVCADIKPSKIIGEKISRDRALNDEEVRALWTVASVAAYPVGPIYKLLILTGLRLNEVCRANWSEFDLEKKLWTIPADRMKGKNHKARPHLVPLTSLMLEILKSIPRFENGDVLFSTTFGRSPVAVGSKIKKWLDAAMAEELRKLAERRGGKFDKSKHEPWVNHDIRRTVRSNLSALKISEEVSEAILAHVPPGIKGTYNVYRYNDEKRDALVQWGDKLHSLVGAGPDPQAMPENVVTLRSKA
jgi:integrase